MNDEVDTIENGAGETAAIGLDLVRGAGTFMGFVAEMTAGAGIHSGD